jgi:hypothetical protein
LAAAAPFFKKKESSPRPCCFALGPDFRISFSRSPQFGKVVNGRKCITGGINLYESLNLIISYLLFFSFFSDPEKSKKKFKKAIIYFLATFLPGITPLFFPLRVRELFLVRWPRQGKLCNRKKEIVNLVNPSKKLSKIYNNPFLTAQSSKFYLLFFAQNKNSKLTL